MFITNDEQKKAARIAEIIRQYPVSSFSLNELISSIDKRIERLSFAASHAKDISDTEKCQKAIKERTDIEFFLVQNWKFYLLSIIEKNCADNSGAAEKRPAFLSFKQIYRDSGFEYLTSQGNMLKISKDPALYQKIYSVIEPKTGAIYAARENFANEKAESAFCLYQICKKGEGLSKPFLEKAKKYLEISADEGFPEANFVLAKFYDPNSNENFPGIIKDAGKAYGHYKKAAMIFENNPDFAKGTAKGIKAAEFGNPVAQHICAMEELSVKNLSFSAKAAEIAFSAEGRVRYYGAEREQKLYSIFKQFKLKIERIKKQATRDIIIKFVENFDKDVMPYAGSFTKKEKKVFEELKKMAEKL